MPNGFTEVQVEALNQAAEAFLAKHEDVRSAPLASLAMREAAGERVDLYERVEAGLSVLRPMNRSDKKTRGAHHDSLARQWEELRKAALKSRR